MLNIKDLPQGSYKVIQPPSGLLNASDVGAKPVTPIKHQSIESLKAQETDAKAQADKGLLGRFFRALPGAAVQVGLGGPTQFAASALEAPKAIVTGKASDKTYTLPGLTPFKSLQSEAQQQVQEGASPLKAIINKGTKTLLEGSEVLGLNQARSKLGEVLSENKVWKLVQPKLAGEELQAANKAGKLTKSSLLRTVKPVKDQELINVAKPYLKTSDPIKGARQITQGVEQEANKLIEGVGNRGGTWSINNLDGAVNKTKIPLGVKGVSDAQVEGVKSYVSTLGKDTPKNAGGALKLAKQFRATINDEFGENIWYKDTPIAKYVRSVNKTLNGFAESLLPDGQLADGSLFSDSMRKQTKLFEALDNVVAKTPKVGTSILSKSKNAVKGVLKTAGVIEGYRILTKGKP